MISNSFGAVCLIAFWRDHLFGGQRERSSLWGDADWLDIYLKPYKGILFRLVWLEIDGDSWLTWFHNLPGKSIYFPKGTPMVGTLSPARGRFPMN